MQLFTFKYFHLRCFLINDSSSRFDIFGELTSTAFSIIDRVKMNPQFIMNRTLINPSREANIPGR